MGKKVQSNYYFDSFPELAHFSVECGEHILEFMKNFDHEKLHRLGKYSVNLFHDKPQFPLPLLEQKLTYTINH